MSLDNEIAELVIKEYPSTLEQASVLVSKVSYLIEERTINKIRFLSDDKEIRDEITKIAELYDLAVDRLIKEGKPLLRKGAILERYLGKIL